MSSAPVLAHSPVAVLTHAVQIQRHFGEVALCVWNDDRPTAYAYAAAWGWDRRTVPVRVSCVGDAAAGSGDIGGER